jgi:hypothetical protein
MWEIWTNSMEIFSSLLLSRWTRVGEIRWGINVRAGGTRFKKLENQATERVDWCPEPIGDVWRYAWMSLPQTGISSGVFVNQDSEATLAAGPRRWNNLISTMPLLWECLAKLMHTTDFTSRKIKLLSPLTNYYAFCVLPTVFRAFLRPLAAANSPVPLS